MIHWCENLDELIDFVAYVVLHAPDEFPEEDYLKPDEQMNLDRAFEEMCHGLDCAAKRRSGAATIPKARVMLEEAYAHYREGRVNPGAWKLQEMSELLETIR